MNSENTSKNNAMQSFSFRRGYEKAMRKDYIALRNDIMKALGITTSAAFYHRLTGKVEPRVSDVPIIEGVFAKYGITDIWGEK